LAPLKCEDLSFFNPNQEWAGLQSIGMVESTRILQDKQTFERRYYITSLANMEKFSQASRSHWEIENKLHWKLVSVSRLRAALGGRYFKKILNFIGLNF
jgi:hypothetical protein